MSDSRDCIIINGIPRQGKSYLAKQEIIPALAKKKAVIIFDKIGEYGGASAKDCPEDWKAYRSIFSFFGSLAESGAKKLQGVHVILCHNDSDYTVGLNWILDQKEPCYIVLDEAHHLFMSGSSNTEAKNALIKLCRYGGHHGIDFVLISQRTKDTPPDFRGMLTSAISFKQRHEGDLQALNSMGFNSTEKILDLDKRQYLCFGELPKELKKLEKNQVQIS